MKLAVDKFIHHYMKHLTRTHLQGVCTKEEPEVKPYTAAHAKDEFEINDSNFEIYPAPSNRVNI